MRYLVVSVIISSTFAATPSVQELRKLIVSAQASHENDNQISTKISRFRTKDRLTDSALADIRALKLGPHSSTTLDLLADLSEFEPSADTSSISPLAPEDAASLLAKTRQFAGKYIDNLPNFLCTAITRRFDTGTHSWVDNSVPGDLLLEDTVVREVSFDHGRDTYKTKMVDSRTPEQSLQGLNTTGEFGSILGSILLTGGAAPVWNRWETVDGKRAAVFRYSIDAAHSRYTVNWLDTKRSVKEMVPAFGGELSIDPATGAIIRLTRHSVLPRAARLAYVDTAIEYQPLLIGDASYIVPVKSVTRSLWKDDPSGFRLSLNEVQFGLYHKFEGESKIAFDDTPEPDPPALFPPTPVVAPISPPESPNLDGPYHPTVLRNPLDATAIAMTAEIDRDNNLKLNIAVDRLDLQQNSGRWQGRLHVMLAQEDPRGKQYDDQDDTLQLDLKPETYQSMLKTGLTYRQALKPNPKAASLRIVVRDESGNLGTVTVPLIPQ